MIRAALKPKLVIARLAKSALRAVGLEVHRVRASHFRDSERESGAVDVPYVENPEVGPANWVEKEARLRTDGPFEWPEIVTLNKAVVGLVGDAKWIIELGGGTGCFAYEAAADPTRHILCSDPDPSAIAWARENRSRPNIEYLDRAVGPEAGRFDLVVAIEVIEHIADYREFLRTCVQLAPRCILTTPNKNRDPRAAVASPPDYYQHVREWTAGEFYWVLRSFYRRVSLYSMPDPLVPRLSPIRITDSASPLVAVCEQPYTL